MLIKLFINIFVDSLLKYDLNSFVNFGHVYVSNVFYVLKQFTHGYLLNVC